MQGLQYVPGTTAPRPLHRELGINASARASLYLYSTPQDVDRFIMALKDSVAFFREMGLEACIISVAGMHNIWRGLMSKERARERWLRAV